jgi:uncharacterized protein YqjF (DUF2071 family)
MRCRARDGWIDYASARRGAGGPAELAARYRPIAPIELAAPGSLEEWLTARYSLFAASRERILRADIDHHAWPLQRAEWELERESVAAAAGIVRPASDPLLHYAHELDVRVWRPHRVG